MALMECPLCKKQEVQKLPRTGDMHNFDCPDCGRYGISGTAVSEISYENDEDELRKIKGWIKDQNRDGPTPQITSYNIDYIVNRPLPSVKERADRIILDVIKGQNGDLGASFLLQESELINITYSKDQSEVDFLIDMLLASGEIIESEVIFANITPKGYLRYEELTSNSEGISNTGFIAMWFDEQMNEAYEKGLGKGVAEAGYNPFRVDQLEHTGKIDDEIIIGINKSKFIVADFTGHRGGVYFEAGYGMGKGLPVFWTCHKNHMNELHFDTRQYNFIAWETTEELAKRLQHRIETVIGEGPFKPKDSN